MGPSACRCPLGRTSGRRPCTSRKRRPRSGSSWRRLSTRSRPCGPLALSWPSCPQYSPSYDDDLADADKVDNGLLLIVPWVCCMNVTLYIYSTVMNGLNLVVITSATIVTLVSKVHVGNDHHHNMRNCVFTYRSYKNLT